MYCINIIHKHVVISITYMLWVESIARFFTPARHSIVDKMDEHTTSASASRPRVVQGLPRRVLSGARGSKLGQ